jgi:hypothetical protein
VSVGRLPGHLGNFPQKAIFGRAKWKFAARLKANFEAYEILRLLTILKNILMNMLLDTRYLVTMLLPLSCECTNELLSGMFTLVISFRLRLWLCLITARISDGGTHAQLSQRVWSNR